MWLSFGQGFEDDEQVASSALGEVGIICKWLNLKAYLLSAIKSNYSLKYIYLNTMTDWNVVNIKRVTSNSCTFDLLLALVLKW